MEAKKTNKADLENKRGLFLELGLVIVLAVVLIAFEWTSKPSKTNTLGQVESTDVEEEIIPITRQNNPPPPPPPPATVVQLNIVQNDVDLENELDIGNMEADQDMQIDVVPFQQEEEVDENEVFVSVEDMPQFEGGDINKFRTWVLQNLKYPPVAAENGISGKVYVQFVVNSKGKVVNAEVIRGVDPALNQEALRVVDSSPKWTPGKQRGKPVKVRFTCPISFVLQ